MKTLKKNRTKHVCGFKGCSKPTYARGLCASDYEWCRVTGTLDKYGLPLKRIRKVTKKKRIIAGQCLLIRDGKDCRRAPESRGLCKGCGKILKARGLYEKFALKSKYAYNPKYKLNRKAKPHECRVIENNKKCKVELYSNGLCRRHYSNMHRKGLLGKFGTPNKKRGK